MKKTFLNHEKALLTTMVQAETPARIKELIDKSLPEGAEAFGMQFCRLKSEYRNEKTYRELFEYTDKPVYITNYRAGSNAGKSDEEIAEELVSFAECGATICDVMGDLYDKNPEELTMNEDAIKKQMNIIDRIHKAGAEVLMSSHVMKYTSAEDVLKIALEHKRRGADISKIVTGAENMEQQIENLRIITVLKEKLGIPFLFLCAGEYHRILRRIGGELGCVMYLCVHEYDELAAKKQPLLKSVKAIRDNM